MADHPHSAVYDQVQQENRQLARDYQMVFAGPEGKRVLADLEMMTGVDTLAFCAEDTHRTAFCAGARSIGLYVRRRLRDDLDAERQEVADGSD